MPKRKQVGDHRMKKSASEPRSKIMPCLGLESDSCRQRGEGQGGGVVATVGPALSTWCRTDRIYWDRPRSSVGFKVCTWPTEWQVSN